jgi:preprotein translocase subunit SecG
MITYLMIFHAIISFLLIIIVLIQFGKGAEAGLISGGASGEMLSGASKGNILTKITIILSIIFLGNSVFLAKLQSKTAATSLLDDEAPIARPLNSDIPKSEEPSTTTP